jgi:hypothetical protein
MIVCNDELNKGPVGFFKIKLLTLISKRHENKSKLTSKRKFSFTLYGFTTFPLKSKALCADLGTFVGCFVCKCLDMVPFPLTT